MQNNSTLYATLRFKRRPVSNAIVCLQLRVAHAAPVHKYALHECDISDYATLQYVNKVTAALAQQFKCSNVALDIKKDVAARVKRNSKHAA